MNGVDRTTGKVLSGIAHLRQSIIDILSTPRGSRIMRREYGSDLYLLIDRPSNTELLIDVYAEVVDALNRWEPRMRVNRVVWAGHQDGINLFDIEGYHFETGQTITFESLELAA